MQKSSESMRINKGFGRQPTGEQRKSGRLFFRENSVTFLCYTIILRQWARTMGERKGDGSMKKILIVEDDRTLNETLRYNLQQQGYDVTAAFSVKEAEDCWQKENFQLALLDVNLPDGESFALCRRWKEDRPETAVVFLTARDLEQDMLQGFAQGADDYIAKPFPVSVLRRKVERILQHLAAGGQGESEGEVCYDDGRLWVDFEKAAATLDGKPLQLTALELRVLRLFTARPAVVLTRQMLLSQLWDAEENFVDEHALTSAVSRIRSKIETPDYRAVKTVYGMGYMWIGGLK